MCKQSVGEKGQQLDPRATDGVMAYLAFIANDRKTCQSGRAAMGHGKQPAMQLCRLRLLPVWSIQV